jgi:predicted acetyltransferase
MSDKEAQLRHFWKTVFDDSDSFIELFFTKVYEEENVVSIQEDGRLVAILHIIPYTMSYWGEDISVAYIYAVGVLPECRGRGLMRQLMQKATETIESRGYAFSTLIPANAGLFEAYRKMGYVEAFDYGLDEYSFRGYKPLFNGIPITVRRVHAADCRLYDLFNTLMHRRNVTVQHSYKTFDFLTNIYMCLAAYTGENLPVGILFATKQTDKQRLLINDVLAANNQIEQRLIREAALRSGIADVIRRRPVGEETSTAMQYGMAVVTNPSLVTDIWKKAHPDRGNADLESLNREQLTQCLLDYPQRTSYMSLMMD